MTEYSIIILRCWFTFYVVFNIMMQLQISVQRFRMSVSLCFLFFHFKGFPIVPAVTFAVARGLYFNDK